MNSWARLACYPRGSFYPVSHGPSTRYRGITKPDFRLCSTCRSRSQAPLCLCTLRRVSIPPEGTFGRLRYLLGGDRPSQTAHLALSPCRVHGQGLGSRLNQGGISRTAPPKLAPRLHRLPPILHKLSPNSIPSCSKAPRGLFVLLRVHGIFTATSISPGPSLRQCPTRYAIRAGRNFVLTPHYCGHRLYLYLFPGVLSDTRWIHFEGHCDFNGDTEASFAISIAAQIRFDVHRLTPRKRYRRFVVLIDLPFGRKHHLGLRLSRYGVNPYG